MSKLLENSFWSKIESFMDEKLPPCVKKILSETGYDNSVSLADMQPIEINYIEESLNKEFHFIIENLECCHSTTYKNQQTFRFLPGHRKLILRLSNVLLEMNELESVASNCPKNSNYLNDLSFLMKTLIETAERNAHKIPTQHRYCEIVRCFAAYIYMTCGKMCYETLCRNLPLPQPSSICKLVYKATN